MTTLAANVNRVIELGDYQDFPMVASDIIFKGAAVGINLSSGHARPLAAGDLFVGFAEAKADNSAGSAAEKDVTVLQRGLVQLAVGSAAITDVGKPVYASDDDTFTLTASINSHVGRIVRFVSTGVVIVAFDATKAGLGGQIAELTDSSGGTANDTVAEVTDLDTSDTYTDAAVNAKLAIVNDNFADITAKMNAILRMLGN